MDGQKISPFYRTMFPIGATAQKKKIKKIKKGAKKEEKMVKLADKQEENKFVRTKMRPKGEICQILSDLSDLQV